MWIERAEKKPVTLTRTVKSLLEKSMMKQSESVYWPTCVFWLVFSSLAYQGEFHVCFNSPQAIGLSSYPQQSSEWAQLPHRASVMSKVAGPCFMISFLYQVCGSTWGPECGCLYWEKTTVRTQMLACGGNVSQLSLWLLQALVCLPCLLQGQKKGLTVFLSSLNPSPLFHFPNAQFTTMAKINLLAYAVWNSRTYSLVWTTKE